MACSLLPGGRSAPAEAPPGLHENGTHVGVRAVDRFLDLLYAEDFSTVASEAVFRDLPCKDDSIPDYPCEGKPQGTLISIIRFSSCSIQALTSRAEISRSLEGLWSQRNYYLHSVLKSGPEASEWQRGFAIEFMGRVDEPYLITFFVDESGRLLSATTCPSWRRPPGSTVLLAPKSK